MPSNWFPLSSFRTQEVFAIPGRFTTAGTGTPTAVLGDGVSVAYAATGIFNVTFDDYFEGLLAIPFDFQVAASSEHRATLTAFSKGSVSANATAQFTISLVAGSVYTADATSNGDSVHFCAFFSKRQGIG